MSIEPINKKSYFNAKPKLA